MLALDEGNPASARSQVEQALALFKEMQLLDGTVLSLYAFAEVATLQGDDVHSQALYEEGIAVARKASDKLAITSGLEGLAVTVAAQGNYAWAAHLWGAAEARREMIGAPLSPVERTPYDRAVSSSRTRLGEQAFATAWAEGRTMSPQQPLSTPAQEALPASTQEEESFSPTPVSPPPHPADLTALADYVLRILARRRSHNHLTYALIDPTRLLNAHPP